jgi:hypothetical protein
MVTTTRAERPASGLWPKGLAPSGPHRKTWPSHPLQKCLEQRRHVAEPEREKDHHMLRPGDVVLRRLQRVGQRLHVPGVGAAQHREIERTHIDAPHRVTGRLSAVGL